MSFTINVKLIGVLSSIYFAYLMLSVDSQSAQFTFNCAEYVTVGEDCNQPDTCMYEYPCNCSQYVHCVSINGPAYLRDCPVSDPPLHFHPATNRCDWIDTSLCIDDPEQCPQDTTTTTLSTTTVITTTTLMPTSSSPQPSTTTQFSTTTSNATNNITETVVTDWTTLDDDVTETSTPATLTSTQTTTTMPSTISSTLTITTVTPMTSVTTAFTSTPLSTNPTEDTTDSITCSTTTCGANHLKTNNKLVYICQTVLLLFIITLSLRI